MDPRPARSWPVAAYGCVCEQQIHHVWANPRLLVESLS